MIIILYPIRNNYRQFIDLSGFWQFCFDLNEEGIEKNWNKGFNHGEPIAVPASWNDQFAEGRDFLGPGWYQTRFIVPWDWDNHKIFLRFGSVNYFTNVWLNGESIGFHEGGHLPFEFEITNKIIQEENLLIVRVDGNLLADRVPPSGRPLDFPSANFDFFPFCGIHRPVLLYCIPEEGIKDIIVITDIENNEGKVNLRVELFDDKQVTINSKLSDQEIIHKAGVLNEGSHANLIISVQNPKLWSPENPYLYNLTIDVLKDGKKFDSYVLNIGIRKVEVKNMQLLLNGEPIILYGFGRHEDFPVTGRGYLPAVIIKDYSLMKWIGANSFRTSHYPYSEQMMDLADKLGLLVINEIPAVGLTFKKDYLDRHLELCKQYLQELIARDKNHPSVIIWSLANEPQFSSRSKEFFRQLYDLAKELDPTRLITLVNMQGVKDRAFEFCDIVCLNRYYAWYTETGKIEKGVQDLSAELDKIYELYNRPIILSEFGADTIPGWHAQPPEMFSEEYQVEFLTHYIELLDKKQYIIGQHVWNLCDFKTPQSIRRMGGINYKGVFTRDRRPKMAAHQLKKLWKR